jgi:phage FluMu gp28-like protein
LYYRVTIADAIEHGLLGVINSVQKTNFTADQFLADCRARAHQEELFQQTYMCNPLGAAANHIVEWSVIERCRFDYKIERVHLEEDAIQRQFGEFSPSDEHARKNQIQNFLREQFPILLSSSASGSGSSIKNQNSKIKNLRLGFDVAASGVGHLAAIYVDEANGDDLWLRALFTCRTQDWHFLETALFFFLQNLRSVQGAGDATGLGRQICWKAANHYGSRFLPVNFSSKKRDLGFALMNQLSVAQKRFPRSDQDIAADFFALRKTFNGSKWAFSEGRNPLNAASHCDMAWAAALATHADTSRRCQAGATVLLDNGMVFDTETGLHMLGSHKEDVLS